MRLQEFLPHLDGVRCLAEIEHVIYKVVITADDNYNLPIGSLDPRPGYTGHVEVNLLGSKERNYAALSLTPSKAKELARRLVEAAERAAIDPLDPTDRTELR